MEEPKVGKAAGNRGKGRKKGVPNKTTALLKDAILKAAEAAGDKEGMIGYLTIQANENPTAFMTLLGKVLPMDATIKHDLTDPIKELFAQIASTGRRIGD